MEETMELGGWIATLYVASGVAAALVTLHTVALWRSPKGREHLSIGVFAAVSLCFCLQGAHVRQLSEVSTHLDAFKPWVATGMLSAAVWPWVIRDFAKLPGCRIPLILSLVWVAQALAQLALPTGLTYAGVDSVWLVSVPEVGIFEYQLRGSGPEWAPLISLPPLALWGYGAYAAISLWRSKLRGRSVGLVLAALPQIGAAIHDGLATSTNYTAPLFSDFGFLLFGLILTSFMADELAQAATTRLSLQRSEDRLRAILNAMPDAVFTLDAEGAILQSNPAATKLAGASASEFAGRPLDEVFELSRIGGGSRGPKGLSTTATFIRTDGERRSVRRSDALLSSEPDHGARVVVLTDVTDQELLEERVRRQRSMESLGQLAGGIAHDFNNMLTGIMGAASLLETMPDDDAREEYLRLIISTSERAADLTGRLLTFGRRGRIKHELVKVGALIVEVAELLERTIDRRIKVELDLCAEPDGVTADPAELHSALLNLALNARDAMPSGGTLSFRTRLVDEEGSGVNRFGFELSRGRYVQIQVRDTGTGIDTRALDRVFEPFFTTKGDGRGTGLGLAAVWGAVHELQGSIEVHSAEGEGTCFQLWIPYQPGEKVLSSRPTQLQDAAGARLLLADDEPVVRRTCERALSRAGFRVVVVNNGQEALDCFTSSADGFQLAVFDVMMPGLSGVEACKRIRALSSSLPFLIMTGFVGDEDLTEVIAADGVFVLRKPFKPGELVQLSLEALEWRAKHLA